MGELALGLLAVALELEQERIRLASCAGSHQSASRAAASRASRKSRAIAALSQSGFSIVFAAIVAMRNRRSANLAAMVAASRRSAAMSWRAALVMASACKDIAADLRLAATIA